MSLIKAAIVWLINYNISHLAAKKFLEFSLTNCSQSPFTVWTNHTAIGFQGAAAIRQIHKYGAKHQSQGSRDIQGGQIEHVPFLRQCVDSNAERCRISGS